MKYVNIVMLLCFAVPAVSVNLLGNKFQHIIDLSLILGKFHSSDECRILKDFKVNGKSLLVNEPVIFPLRCILLKEYKPEVWKIILELEHHCEERRGTVIWKRNSISIEPFIR